jgi:hypothetical protein
MNHEAVLYTSWGQIHESRCPKNWKKLENPFVQGSTLQVLSRNPFFHISHHEAIVTAHTMNPKLWNTQTMHFITYIHRCMRYSQTNEISQYNMDRTLARNPPMHQKTRRRQSLVWTKVGAGIRRRSSDRSEFLRLRKLAATRRSATLLGAQSWRAGGRVRGWYAVADGRGYCTCVG